MAQAALGDVLHFLRTACADAAARDPLAAVVITPAADLLPCHLQGSSTCAAFHFTVALKSAVCRS